MNPKVSIIVPCHNSAPYLEDTLLSIQGQTYENIEVLLIDDGSTDQTGAICDEYMQKDSRFHTYHRPQAGGVSAARNHGLEHMTGDYVMFVDSDDLVKPEYVEVMVRAATETNGEIVTCRYISGRKASPEEFFVIRAARILQLKPFQLITLCLQIGTPTVLYGEPYFQRS